MVTGSNGGTSDGEDIKDLWIFHFTDLPDLSAAVSSELRGACVRACVCVCVCVCMCASTVLSCQELMNYVH